MTSNVRIGLNLIIIFALIATIIFTTSNVKAADAPAQFGIKPATAGTATTSKGYFILKAQTNETLTDAITVSNPGTVPVKLLVYPVDAITGQQSGVSYLNQTAPKIDVGSWVTLGTTTVDLEPNKQLTIPFKLTIPKDALPGQHLGAIAAELVTADAPTTSNTTQNNASMGVKTVTRTLTAVQINVGGSADIASLAIKGSKIIDFNDLPTLSLGLENTGTGLIQPKGTVTLTDSAGKVVMNTPVSLESILPRNSIDYPVNVDLPAAGTYKVHASLDFGGTAPAGFDGTVEVKAPTVKAVVAAPTVQPRSNTGQVAVAQPAATTGSNAAVNSTRNSNSVAPASSDSNSMLMGMLIGVLAVAGLGILGFCGFLMFSRGKKSNY
jgi:hypothetical protein